MAEITALVTKRASLKGSITRIEKFTNEITDAVTVIELKNRLEHLEEIYVKYDEVQFELEIRDNNEHGSDREHVENRYLNLKARLREKIEKKNIPVANLRESPLPSVLGIPHLNLPKIYLPNFNGEYHKWQNFKDLFINLVHDCPNLSGIQKLYYLKSALKGEASTLIECLHASEENYVKAWDTLIKRYDNKAIILQAHLKGIFELPHVNKNSHSSFRGLLSKFGQHFNSLKSLGVPIDHWDIMLVHVISQKLDSDIVRVYENQRDQSQFPNLSQFLEFLEQRCSTLELTSRDVNTNSRRTSTHTTQVNSNTKCLFCNNNNHVIGKCHKFAALSIEDRRSFVKEKKLCFRCLKNNHFSSQCFSKENCSICKGKHNSLLHIDETKKVTTPAAAAVENVVKANVASSHEDASTSSTDVCTSSLKSNEMNFDMTNTGIVLWPSAIVNVLDECGNKHKCRALLDSASEKNYVTASFISKINVTPTSSNWQVCGVSDTTTLVKDVVNLNVTSRDALYKFKAEFGILNNITGPSPKREVDMRSLKWPRHIMLADPTFSRTGNIDMLLGTEVFAKSIKNGTIDLGINQPVMQNTRFGWVIHGAKHDNVIRDEITQTLVCSVSDVKDVLTKFWQVEEFTPKRHLTSEERECENRFIESVSRNKNGRYEVDLPVIENKLILLGDSYDYAYRCLLSLERRFLKNPELYKTYRSFINEYIELGHAKIVDLNDQNSPDMYTFYMPHHAVIKESSSTTKLRVVFNASAPSTTGVSLNDILLIGPVVQPDLVTVLLRCRTPKYLLIADMAKMYRQVNIKPKYQALQRILWRDAPEQPIKCLQLTTVTYGTASASFLATRALMQLVTDDGDSFPLASEAIKSNSYVDDIITGDNDIEVLKVKQTELIKLLAKGGFELHKWSSNDQRLLANIPDERLEKQNICLTNEDSIRTLGIIWNPTSDVFEIGVSDDVINNNKFTKRSVLSCIAKIFDPLGLTGPVIAQAKIIMQNIWKENLNWDDPIPSHIKNCWITFQQQLSSLRQISIPRLISEDAVELQLLGFADASMRCYGAVVYLRSLNTAGNWSVKLICSKSRVAPLKTISLPRLELCAALLLARLTNKVSGMLNLNINKVKLWTDSTIALSWICSEPSRWNVFVANRVSEIQELSSVDDWRHVKSSDNPADLLSRGIEPQYLKNKSLWWDGPPWLSSNEENWPDNLYQVKGLENLPEQSNRQHVLAGAIKEINYFYEIFNKYSSFNRLRRVMAYVIRFVRNLKVTEENRKRDFLRAEELHGATKFIISVVQGEHFAKEIKSLRCKADSELKDSRLRLLNPFLDNESLLRVGGRLKQCPVSMNQRHPLIIPEKSHVTKLIIVYEHEKLFHAGMQLLLANVRLNYWPLNARNAVKRVIHHCIKCFRFRASTANQIMSDLPSVRVTPARPFLYTGVDYAGPISIKQSRIRKSVTSKGYICLFVCMSTKAIHLELVIDMTTKSFLNALHRFMSRRGKCAKLFSDNGTNFKGAHQELKDLYSLFNKKTKFEQINNDLTKEGIEWQFIPPSSPHWGGIWEAGVKSVKYHLKRLIGSTALTYEELNTALIEIEGILNSRPLCPLSNDPNDFEYLSPSHFLIGDVLTSTPEVDVTHQPINRLKFWQQIKQVKQVFWKRWNSEYISELQQRKKWYTHKPDVNINELVLVKEDNVPPLEWRLARVMQVHKGKDGHVRSVTVKTKQGNYTRPIVKICVLPRMS